MKNLFFSFFFFPFVLQFFPSVFIPSSAAFPSEDPVKGNKIKFPPGTKTPNMSVLVQLPNPTRNPSKDAKMDFCSFIFSIFCFMWILFPQRIVGERGICVQISLLFSCSKFHTVPPASVSAPLIRATFCTFFECFVGRWQTSTDTKSILTPRVSVNLLPVNSIYMEIHKPSTQYT